MNRKLEELLGKGEAMKEGLEKVLNAMGRMEAAICGITALMAWIEDCTAQTTP